MRRSEEIDRPIAETADRRSRALSAIECNRFVARARRPPRVCTRVTTPTAQR
jgi:hypothetical protein